MKALKFREKLVKPILTGQKTSTWRLFDDKDIQAGDILEFIVWQTNKTFAQAEVTSVQEKSFNKLNTNDLVGHEKFKLDSVMYKQYSRYYKREVDGKTIVKIIKFNLIKSYEQ